MPQDVTDVLIEAVKEVKDDIKEIKRDIEAMRNEMHAEHAKVLQRIMSLEHSAKITRWVFAAAGSVTALVLREVIPLLL